MEDIEITTLPVADTRDLPKLRTLGYTADGSAAQLPVTALVPQTIKAASIDFPSGRFIACQPFIPGTSEVYVNGLRYFLGTDYMELSGNASSEGFILPGIDSTDEIVLKAVVVIPQEKATPKAAPTTLRTPLTN
jgi:hypothetical protein